MAPQPVPSVPPVPYPPGAVSRPKSTTSSSPSPFIPISTTSPSPILSYSFNQSLLTKVLQQRQIQIADQLFSIPDYEIITEVVSFKKIYNLKKGVH